MLHWQPISVWSRAFSTWQIKTEGTKMLLCRNFGCLFSFNNWQRETISRRSYGGNTSTCVAISTLENMNKLRSRVIFKSTSRSIIDWWQWAWLDFRVSNINPEVLSAILPVRYLRQMNIIGANVMHIPFYPVRAFVLAEMRKSYPLSAEYACSAFGLCDLLNRSQEYLKYLKADHFGR